MNTQWKRRPCEERGVICGCDHRQEWLLPWWWERYSFNNNYPVLFCDYGMSEKARAWCQERGEVAPILFDDSRIKPRKDVPAILQKKWGKAKINWSCRAAWYKKPFALLESPYKMGVWLDMDCEVLSHLGDLFDYCSSDVPLAMSLVEGTVPSQLFLTPSIYNGGVVVFRHGLDILTELAEWSLEWNHQFFSDDHILSYFIEERNLPIAHLPKEWNWEPNYGVNLYARIFHWIRSTKELLKTQGGIKPLRDTYEQLFKPSPE